MANQLDPLANLKSAMIDIEAKIPMLPKISTTLPAPPTPGRTGAGILGAPTEIFRKVEEILPAGAPRMSGAAPRAGAVVGVPVRQGVKPAVKVIG